MIFKLMKFKESFTKRDKENIVKKNSPNLKKISFGNFADKTTLKKLRAKNVTPIILFIIKSSSGTHNRIKGYIQINILQKLSIIIYLL